MNCGNECCAVNPIGISYADRIAMQARQQGKMMPFCDLVAKNYVDTTFIFAGPRAFMPFQRFYIDILTVLKNKRIVCVELISPSFLTMNGTGTDSVANTIDGIIGFNDGCNHEICSFPLKAINRQTNGGKFNFTNIRPDNARIWLYFTNSANTVTTSNSITIRFYYEN